MSDQFLPGTGVPGRPRLTHKPFPPYSYVPGHAPHPVTDPTGHLFGQPADQVAPLDPDNWRYSPTYLWAIDLFNHGYYWEAHEAWEGLWHAAGRTGPVADFLKGLIKLAAAAVKAREGNAAGVARHARRARELFDTTAARAAAGHHHSDAFAGLRWIELRAYADAMEKPGTGHQISQPAPHRILGTITVVS